MVRVHRDIAKIHPKFASLHPDISDRASAAPSPLRAPDRGRPAGGVAGGVGQPQHHSQAAQALVCRHEGCGRKVAKTQHQASQRSKTNAKQVTFSCS